MARPKNSDSEQTRARILDAAIHLFGEHGREGASMREIARKAGFSQATLAHHFDTKQGLFDACVDRVYQEFLAHRDELSSQLFTSADPREVVDRMVRVGFAFAWRHRSFVRIIVVMAVSTGHAPPQVFHSVLLPTLDLGSKLLSGLTGRSELEMRLAILSVNHLISRFSLCETGELVAMLGLPPDTDAEALEAVVTDHVVAVAQRIAFGTV